MSEDIPAQRPEFRAGSVLAGYRMERKLGAGGMAVVFRALDERLGRPVALKILSPGVASDSEFRRRFIAESQAAAAVDDPHIIPVYDAGEAGGVLFIAMRYVAGGDLRQMLAREGSLPPDQAADFVSQVASALDAAHSAGLVHRDVKPGNILVDRRPGRPDHVYLSDFGIVRRTASERLTRVGANVGTPDYMAPEQIADRDVDGRTDQYSLACVTVQLLTGAVPFERDQLPALIYAHLAAPPPSLVSQRPDLPAAVDQVVAKAMAKTPDKRYESCGDFADALREALGLASYRRRGSADALLTPPPGTAEAAAPAYPATMDSIDSRPTPSTVVPAEGPRAAEAAVIAGRESAAGPEPSARPAESAGERSGLTAPADVAADASDVLAPGQRPGADAGSGTVPADPRPPDWTVATPSRRPRWPHRRNRRAGQVPERRPSAVPSAPDAAEEAGRQPAGKAGAVAGSDEHVGEPVLTTAAEHRAGVPDLPAALAGEGLPAAAAAVVAESQRTGDLGAAISSDVTGPLAGVVEADLPAAGLTDPGSVTALARSSTPGTVPSEILPPPPAPPAGAAAPTTPRQPAVEPTWPAHPGPGTTPPVQRPPRGRGPVTAWIRRYRLAVFALAVAVVAAAATLPFIAPSHPSSSRPAASASPSISARPAAIGFGWVSLGNLSQTPPSADVYLYSSGRSSPQFVQHGVAYGVISPYHAVNAGDYTVKVRAAGATASSNPVWSVSFRVHAGGAYTVAPIRATAQRGQLRVIDNDLTAPPGKSLVRVIQADINQGQVTFHCSCAAGVPGNITTDAAPSSVSRQVPIPVGTWTMTATGPSMKTSLPVALTDGTVHNEIVISKPGGGLEIINLVQAPPSFRRVPVSLPRNLATSLISSVAFSPSGATLAIAAAQICLWDVAATGCTRAFGNQRSAYSLAFSPDGKTLAVAGGIDSASTELWDVATGSPTATLTAPNPGMYSVAFTHNGKLLAVGDGNGHAYLWDVATRKLIFPFTGPGAQGVNSVAFSPDDKILVAGDGNGHTYLWDIATRKLVFTLSDPDSKGVLSVAFSPDGKLLVAGDGNGHTYLWDVATGKPISTLPDPGAKAVVSVACSPDNTTMAAGGGHGSIDIWNVRNGKLLATLADPSQINSVAFSPDGQILAVGDNNGGVFLWYKS